MTRSILRSTTALTLGLALAAPELLFATPVLAPHDAPLPGGRVVLAQADASEADESEGDEGADEDDSSSEEEPKGEAEEPEEPEKAPAQEAPAEEAPAEESAPQEAPAQDAPAEEAPAEEAPAAETPAQEAPAQEAPAEEAPAQEAPAEEAPAEESAPQEAPAQEAPAQETPAQEAPAEEAPAQEAPAQEAPAAEAPTQEAPTEEAPATEAPTQEAPAQEAPRTEEAPAAPSAEPAPATDDRAPAEEAAPTPEQAPAAPEAAPAGSAEDQSAPAGAPAEGAAPDTGAPAPDAFSPSAGDAGPAADAERATAPSAGEPVARPEAQAGAVDEEDPLAAALEEAARGEGGEMEVPQEDTEATAARASEAPTAAAAAQEEVPAPGDLESQVLTEEDTRSSSEAFEEDDEGLSNFERALIAGLGAVAVGAVLNNGGRVVQNTGDRVVIDREGELQVLKNDDVLLRRPGSTVSSRTYDDGSTLTIVEREDGTTVTTIRAANGQALRRTRTLLDGTTVLLFDDTQAAEPVDVAELKSFRARSGGVVAIDDLRAALEGAEAVDVGRRFSLQQVRQIRAVRDLMPQVEVAAVEFDTGSAVIRASEAEDLRDIGEGMASAIAESPDEVFLVEGHTDAVGTAASNLALSDRRAESVALALTEYFDVPPESMIAQGYGEANLKVQTTEAERENRRGSVRRITPLLRGAELR